jgi:hypothetical protein
MRLRHARVRRLNATDEWNSQRAPACLQISLQAGDDRDKMLAYLGQ